VTPDFSDLHEQFSVADLQILAQATADDMLAPAGTIGARVPEQLRAKFMAAVINRIPAVPMPPDASLETDPQ